VERDVESGRGGPIAGPGDRGGGQVDGIDLKARGGQVQRVAAGAAAEVQGPAGGDQPSVEVRHQVLIGLIREERHGPVPVCVEAVPPVGAAAGRPPVGTGREQPVQQFQHVLDVADVAVHPASSPPGQLSAASLDRAARTD
jgi:hypothetical protein